MKKQSDTFSPIVKWGHFAIANLFIILGILFMVFPETSVSVMITLSGIIMMIFGAIKIAGHFSRDFYRVTFQFDLELGILLAVLGLAVLLKPKGAVSFLCIALGISVFTDGLFKMRIAFESKKYGVPHWWIILIVSVLAMLIGLILVFRPASSASVIMVILGLSLIVDGILNLCVAVTFLRIIKEEEPDVIEIDDFEFRE